MTANLRLVQSDLHMAGEDAPVGEHRGDGGGPLLGGPVTYPDDSGSRSPHWPLRSSPNISAGMASARLRRGPRAWRCWGTSGPRG